MSVKIEILDYRYDEGENLVNVNLASSGLSATKYTVNSITSVNWNGGGGGGFHFLSNPSSFDLVIGQTYNIHCEITNKVGTDNVGFSSSSGVGTSARLAGNGVIDHTFVATATSFPDLFAYTNNTATISHIRVTNANAIDWEYSVIGELDVTDHSDFPLAMTFQISDIKDLTATTGDYSKTFKIPATKHNNKLLKHPYIANIKKTTDITENKKCRILVNNLFSLIGLIKVTGIGGYGETPSYYDCVFFGNNLSWSNDLDGKYLNEVNWGVKAENLTYNRASIMQTWSDSDCDSSDSLIVYPVTSYGDYNPSGTEKTIQLLDTASNAISTGSTGYFGFNDSGDSYETPLPSPDWRPAIFVKDTLEKIFNDVGYAINSTFMNTDLFKRLVWLLPNFKYNNADERISLFSYSNKFKGEGFVDNFSTTIPGDNAYDWTSFSVDLNDAGADFVLGTTYENNGWDVSNGIFTAQEYGYYSIRLTNFGVWCQLTPYSGGIVTIDYVKLEVQVRTVGHSTGSAWTTIDSSQSGGDTFSSSSDFSGAFPFPPIDGSHWLNKGDLLRLRVKVKAKASFANALGIYFFGSSTPTSTTTSDNANAQYVIEADTKRVEYGQTYDLKDVINKNYKQVDFIKGVSHAFNLKMTTDSTTRSINIEPFDDFYKPYSKALDWTYKLDRNKEIKDKWLKSDLKRNVIFKYKTDSKDKKVEARGEQHFDGIKDEYPYQKTLPKTFEKGESKFENPFFAGTYNGIDQDTVLFSPTDTAYSAILWEENYSTNDNGRPDKGYDFQPRLLYWNKYSPTGMPSPFSTFDMYKFAAVQTWASDIDYLNPNADSGIAGSIISNVYPQATSVNSDDVLSPVLTYGNVWIRNFDDVDRTYAGATTGEGLYQTYYRNMFEMLKSQPRVRNVYVDLKITDIVNLDFRKLIYIDGVYWRVIKIVDYQANKNQSTKVELIEYPQLGTFAATAPAYNGYTNPWGGWNPDTGSHTGEPDNEL